jgi:hypothetical protein
VRKVLAIVIAGIAVLCLVGVVAAFATAPKPSTSAPDQHATAAPSRTTDATMPSAAPATPGTVFTTDATIADIPTWITPTYAVLRAHSIHVWIATANCMHKLGYADFHYRVFWAPQAVARDSENFWTTGMSSAEAAKALTDEFGPTLLSESTTGCHGRALVALQHQFLNGH